MHLPDINLWLALSFESHGHHVAARRWFDAREAESCAFCRLTQMGFLRLATNPKAFGPEAVQMEGAWGLYDQFLSDERVVVIHEPARIEDRWRAQTSGGMFSPKLWNDAYLAAFALVADVKLVTFDRGFRQFEGLNGLILS
jgi:toxin-antitoxin system PIN domain toxin